MHQCTLAIIYNFIHIYALSFVLQLKFTSFKLTLFSLQIASREYKWDYILRNCVITIKKSFLLLKENFLIAMEQKCGTWYIHFCSFMLLITHIILWHILATLFSSLNARMNSLISANYAERKKKNFYFFWETFLWTLADEFKRKW